MATSCRVIGQLKSLRVLDLHGNGAVKSEGLAHLAGLTNLEELDCSGLVDAGDNCLAVLLQLPGLKSLAMSGTAISARCGAQLAKLERLTRLELSGPAASDPVLTELAKSANGGKLRLEGLSLTMSFGLTNEGLDQLTAASTQLRSLELSGCNQVMNLGFLHHLPELRHLDLSGLALGSPGEFFGLAGASRALASLRLARCTRLDDASVEALLPLRRRLTSLDLNGCEHLGNKALNTIEQLTCLESLDLSGTGVGESALCRLIRLTRLTELRLARLNLRHGHGLDWIVCLRDLKVKD